MENKNYATPEEIAKMLGVTVVTVYRYMKRKHNPLPHYKLTDRNFTIKISDFESWMESRFVN